MDTDHDGKRQVPTGDDDTTNVGTRDPGEPLLDYVCHPARRDAKITTLVTVFIVVCIVIVWLISFSPLLTALAVLILFGSLTGFYFPTRYMFYDDHLKIKTKMQTLRKDWTQYRSYYPDKNGVLLSPFGRPTRLENFRGLYVKFAGNREQVMAIIRSKIEFEDES